MTLPLFDSISLPPNVVLIDINALTPDSVREQYQGIALGLWVEETNESWEDFAAREWDDNEGIFVVTEDGTVGTAIGVVVVVDVEAL